MSDLPLELPPGWEVLDSDGAPDTVALIAAEPEESTDRLFRPNLVLTVGDLSLEEQAPRLRSFHLVDREETVLAGSPCVRTLAHHEMNGRAVVVEQWRLLGPDGSRELTASCGALDYPELSEEISTCAASVRIGYE